MNDRHWQRERREREGVCVCGGASHSDPLRNGLRCFMTAICASSREEQEGLFQVGGFRTLLFRCSVLNDCCQKLYLFCTSKGEECFWFECWGLFSMFVAATRHETVLHANMEPVIQFGREIVSFLLTVKMYLF